MFILECGISLTRAGCLLVHLWQKHFPVFPEEPHVSSLAGSQSAAFSASWDAIAAKRENSSQNLTQDLL